jgi:hypothetical protein
LFGAFADGVHRGADNTRLLPEFAAAVGRGRFIIARQFAPSPPKPSSLRRILHAPVWKNPKLSPARRSPEKNQAYKDADANFGMLDIYIRNRYRNQPAKLAAWKIASHIERSAKR